MNLELNKKYKKKLIEMLKAINSGKTSWRKIGKELGLESNISSFHRLRGLAEGLELIKLDGNFQGHDEKRLSEKGKEFLEEEKE